MTGIVVFSEGKSKPVLETIKIRNVFFKQVTVFRTGSTRRDNKNLKTAFNLLSKEGIYRITCGNDKTANEMMKKFRFMPVSHLKVMRALVFKIAEQYLLDGWHLSLWLKPYNENKLAEKLCSIYNNVEVINFGEQNIRKIIAETGNSPAIFESKCHGRLRFIFENNKEYDTESPAISINFTGKGKILDEEYGDISIESDENLIYPKEYCTDINTVLWENDNDFLNNMKIISLIQ